MTTTTAATTTAATTTAATTTLPGSFRDPAGFLFCRKGILYRQINEGYAPSYELLRSSGLYDELVNKKWLIAHDEVDKEKALTDDAYQVIEPELLPFISYPYEWSFSQLKDAARLTLDIQEAAFAKKLSLRDASAYNVQFLEGKPVFIDTLSFEPLVEGQPWVAYRQFCQHFVAPLALMSRVDIRLGQLLRVHIDGIPLDLASSLLPAMSKWNLSLGLHIHMHAKSQQKYAGEAVEKKHVQRKMTSRQLLGLFDGLRQTVEKLQWKPGGTEWYDYYQANNNYGHAGLEQKERLIAELIAEADPKTVWDIGGNTGRFSRLAANHGAHVVCWDIDPGCVEANYGMVSKHGEKSLLPLLLDLTNPSPGIGWNHDERMSLRQRGPVDTLMALGLIHHLAISNNTPLPQVARFMGKSSTTLIIEFVPKSDSQVKKLLTTREDIFPDYSRAGFEVAFREVYEFIRVEEIPGTERIIYLMKKRNQ
ncbi:MAG: SAM-dependent methyltransferase [Myxococcota bacterium]|nr:SAM-dependent methyltransferase [Myxococcota bacterium]